MAKKEKILIIEDTKFIIKLITQLLEEYYDVKAAEDGQAGLDVVEDYMPDVILLDVMMPRLNGFEVCKALKESSKTKDIPVIFLTGTDSVDDVVKGFELGAVDYISKPVDDTILLARIKTHLELKKSRDKIKKHRDKLKDVNQQLASQRDELNKVNEQLQAINDSKDQFLSLIAHDLRGPFTSLVGFSNYLMTEIDDLSFDEIKKYSKFIYDSSNRTYVLLETLLKWARSQMGKMQVNAEKNDLYLVSSAAMEIVHVNANKKDVVLVNKVKKDTFAYFDSNMIDTVIRNLVSNSLKFTPAKGEIKLSVEDKDDFVEVLVADTGVGMSAEAVNNLFKIGVCVTTTGTEGEQGTGLGLILCKEFVEKNGGDIRVESKEGKGTTFFVTLPKAK